MFYSGRWIQPVIDSVPILRTFGIISPFHGIRPEHCYEDDVSVSISEITGWLQTFRLLTSYTTSMMLAWLVHIFLLSFNSDSLVPVLFMYLRVYMHYGWQGNCIINCSCTYVVTSLYRKMNASITDQSLWCLQTTLLGYPSLCLIQNKPRNLKNWYRFNLLIHRL